MEGREKEAKEKEERKEKRKEIGRKRGKILRSRGSVGLWCWASAALAPEKGGHHEVGGPPGPAPQLDKCTSTNDGSNSSNEQGYTRAMRNNRLDDMLG